MNQSTQNRRKFLFSATALTGMFTLPFTNQAKSKNLSEALTVFNQGTPSDHVDNEELWNRIHQAYTINPNMVNLNNGGVSPQPRVVQDAMIKYYQWSNETPSYYMWRILGKDRESVRGKLSELTGSAPDTLALCRNTTEALGNAIMGIHLEKGDEVVVTKQDYPNVMHAWNQRAQRDGVVLKKIDIDYKMTEDEIVQLFQSATTKKTKVWQITHLINWNGLLTPARKLSAEAKKRNVISIVDGAHSFAQFNFKIADLGCDYFGTSLHKWLCAPFGTGMLYVRPERISETYPLIPSTDPFSDDIRKFESLGTRSFATELAIGTAVNFHQSIGSQLKEERLRFLKNYWVNKVKNHSKISMTGPIEDHNSGSLCLMSIEGFEPNILTNKLQSEFNIHTTNVKWENMSGIRISPHVYTRTQDLDRLVEAILKIADES